MQENFTLLSAWRSHAGENSTGLFIPKKICILQAWWIMDHVTEMTHHARFHLPQGRKKVRCDTVYIYLLYWPDRQESSVRPKAFVASWSTSLPAQIPLVRSQIPPRLLPICVCCGIGTRFQRAFRLPLLLPVDQKNIDWNMFWWKETSRGPAGESLSETLTAQKTIRKNEWTVLAS